MKKGYDKLAENSSISRWRRIGRARRESYLHADKNCTVLTHIHTSIAYHLSKLTSMNHLLCWTVIQFAAALLYKSRWKHKIYKKNLKVNIFWRQLDGDWSQKPAKRTYKKRPSDFRLPSNASSARHHHRRHNIIVCISCCQSRHHKNLISFFLIARTAHSSSQAWRTLVIILRADYCVLLNSLHTYTPIVRLC
jgi:hypothetical protein